jgi:hypothetical protein
LRHRLRNILQPGDHMDMVLEMYDAPSVAAGAFHGGPDGRPGAIAAAKLRPRRRKLALAVTTSGAVLVARLTKLRGPELVQRFDSTAAVGATTSPPQTPTSKLLAGVTRFTGCGPTACSDCGPASPTLCCRPEPSSRRHR